MAIAIKFEFEPAIEMLKSDYFSSFLNNFYVENLVILDILEYLVRKYPCIPRGGSGFF